MGYFGMGLSQGIQQGQERKRQRELLDLQKKQLTAQATQMDVENELKKLQVSALGEKLKAEAALPEAMAGIGGPPPAPLAPGAQGPVPPADFQPPLDMQRLRSLGLMAQRAGYDPAQLFQTMALADPRIRQVLQGKQLIHLKPDETLGQLSPEGQFTTLATGVQKPKVPSFGDAVESVSSELFNLPFTDLNQPQKESVNQTIQARKMEAKGFGDTVESVSSELFDSSFAGLSQAQKARVNQTVQARKVDVAGSAEIMKHNIVREQPLGKEHDNWLDPETLLPAPANLKTGQAFWLNDGAAFILLNRHLVLLCLQRMSQPLIFNFERDLFLEVGAGEGFFEDAHGQRRHKFSHPDRQPCQHRRHTSP